MHTQVIQPISIWVERCLQRCNSTIDSITANVDDNSNTRTMCSSCVEECKIFCLNRIFVAEFWFLGFWLRFSCQAGLVHLIMF